jgi:molecular chaperone DnaK (HSP70)
MKTEYSVGIDLGTTNTLCAVWEKGQEAPWLLDINQPVRSFEARGFDRSNTLPSVVSVEEGGEVFAGVAARELAKIGRPGVFRSIKRCMGMRWRAHAGGRIWTPPRISGCILKAIAQELAVRFGSPPQEVVVTVPASFDTDARHDTLVAATLAGFDPWRIRIFDEPSAALLHHVQRKSLHDLPAGKLMMVDIGGGTLDVALLEISRTPEGSVELDILGRSRYTEVAGDDFDLHLAAFLLARYEEEAGRPVEDSDPQCRQFFSELLGAAEAVKCRLSSRYHEHERVSGRKLERAHFAAMEEAIHLHRTPDGKPWTTQLNLQELGETLRYFFPGWAQTTYGQCAEDGRFFEPIVSCLDSAVLITGHPVASEDLRAVYLCGGSAYLPMVSAAVQKVTALSPVLVDEPMHAVALGAAWLAGLRQGYGGAPPKLTERLCEGVYLKTNVGDFVELLSPREQVPVQSRELAGKLFMGQLDRCLVVELFIGNSADDPDLQPLARRRLDFGALLPGGHPIRLEITVDENRRMHMKFVSEHDGKTLRGHATVATSGGWINEDEIGEDLPAVNQPNG